MWKLISDCGKQLNAGFRIKQTISDGDVFTNEYVINEINLDNYVLQLIARTKGGDPLPADPAEVLVFSC